MSTVDNLNQTPENDENITQFLSTRSIPAELEKTLLIDGQEFYINAKKADEAIEAEKVRGRLLLKTTVKENKQNVTKELLSYNGARNHELEIISSEGGVFKGPLYAESGIESNATDADLNESDAVIVAKDFKTLYDRYKADEDTGNSNLNFNTPNGISFGTENTIKPKAFNISSIADITKGPPYTFELDSVEGLKANDLISVCLFYNGINWIYVDIGIINTIDEDTNTITFSEYRTYEKDGKVINTNIPDQVFAQLKGSSLKLGENNQPITNSRVNSLWVNQNPTLGTKEYVIYNYAEGNFNITTGSYSHAEGYAAHAGYLSHAEGNQTQALNESHAEGYKTYAYGENSHAEGGTTSSMGQNSHAEGTSTVAKGNSSHAEGCMTRAEGTYSHAEGVGQNNAYVIASGTASHAEGSNTLAEGEYSHAEGRSTIAKGASSHAEGVSVQAVGASSHAEGYNTYAGGDYSHAEGSGAGGSWSYANGAFSHAEGKAVTASGEAQHVQGRFNISDPSFAHIVGNGTDNDNRSNAHTIDWDGNAWFAGDVYVGGTNQTTGKKLVTEEIVNNKIAAITEAAPEILNTLSGLSDFSSGKLDANYLIGGQNLELGKLYEESGQYFCYIDIDNTEETLDNGMYLFVYDMEIVSATDLENIKIGGQNTNLKDQREGITNYPSSKFITEKCNHVYYPFIVDNEKYSKYGVYYRNTAENSSEFKYKIHNIGLYKLNELATNINSFEIGLMDNGGVITTLSNSNPVLSTALNIYVKPSAVIYKSNNNDFIALLDKITTDNVTIYSTSIQEINNVKLPTIKTDEKNNIVYANFYIGNKTPEDTAPIGSIWIKTEL